VEVNGHLHPPGALALGKEPLIPIGEAAGWATKPVWTWWQREKSLLCLRQESNLSFPVHRQITILSYPAP